MTIPAHKHRYYVTLTKSLVDKLPLGKSLSSVCETAIIKLVSEVKEVRP